MAWRSIGKDNNDLVAQLAAHNIIKSDKVKHAMEATDRRHYCPTRPYVDAPQSIGYGVTISAPHMHAYALELLAEKLHPDAHVLDVGSGSGYLTACFARLLKPNKEEGAGYVVGIEHEPELVKLGRDNIMADDPKLLSDKTITIIEGDGRQGFRDKEPYDAIHVGAASPETPIELIRQLAPGGRLICPVGPERGEQYLEQFDKNENGEVNHTRLMGVMYVPLTDLCPKT